MSLTKKKIKADVSGAPRASGDEPKQLQENDEGGACSPRQRG